MSSTLVVLPDDPSEEQIALYLDPGRDAARRDFEAAAIDLDPEGEQVYLVLYGTGISGSALLESAVLTIGGTAVPVIYAGPQGQFPGLDQINAGPLPRSLQGRGVVDAILTVNGKTSNRVELRFR